MIEQNELKKEDFNQPTAVIRLTHCYHTGIETERVALYDATRAYWSIKKNHAITDTKLALAVHDGIVLEVYTIAAWLPANSTLMAVRLDKSVDKNRKEFVGDIASDSIREKYLGKSVRSLFKPGNQDPVRCFGSKS